MSPLYEYGILDDKSDYRIHVGFNIKRVYVFPTKNAAELIRENNNRYKVGYATQPGALGSITGSGWLVPWRDIEGCKEVKIPIPVWLRNQPLSNDNTSIKGQKAITVCMEMLQRGLIPISLTPICVSDLEMQIEGKDLLVIRSEMSVQVKCDAKCGGDSRNWPHWTGNLFLQKGERNIFGAY